MKLFLFVVTCCIAQEVLDPCLDGSIDAATRTKDGSTYLFKGDYYWEVVKGGIAYGYPRLISDDWEGIMSGPIDAAFTWNDGSTFIFKGDKYWRFLNQEAKKGYPKKISEGFKRIPDNVDAALVWETDGATYFFKGSQYWKYSPKNAVPTEGIYPAPISSWNGIPNNITAAIQWQRDITYFFKDSQYYGYDNKGKSVPSGFPYSTSEGWFLCDDKGNFRVSDGHGHILEREQPEISSRNLTNEIFPGDLSKEMPFKKPENGISNTPANSVGIQGKFANPCLDGSVDAATRTQDGSIYLFKGDYYWKIVKGGVAYGYPRLIFGDWNGILSGPIDAAVTWNDGSTFIFQGKQYWRFYNKEVENDYPRKISHGFKGIPDNVDSALVWGSDGVTYFTKGKYYWRYAPKEENPTAGNYPVLLDGWNGIPDNVTAAIRWVKGQTLFFKGSFIYEYEGYKRNNTNRALFACDNKQNFKVVNVTVGNGFERERPNYTRLEKALKYIKDILKDVV